jgi:hypothetical protein
VDLLLSFLACVTNSNSLVSKQRLLLNHQCRMVRCSTLACIFFHFAFMQCTHATVKPSVESNLELSLLTRCNLDSLVHTTELLSHASTASSLWPRTTDSTPW